MAAALRDAEIAPAAIAPPLFLVGDAASWARLRMARGGPVHFHGTLADAVVAAVAALRAGPGCACVVGAVEDCAPLQAAWLVLAAAGSAADQGAAAYAEILCAAPLAAAAPEPAAAAQPIGWLELPGGESAATAAEQAFSPAAAVLAGALRCAAVAPPREGGQGVRDALALIRAALALGHKVLPFRQLPEDETGPAASTLPWIQPLPHPGWSTRGWPRRAGWLAAGADDQPICLLLQEEESAVPRRDAAIPLAQQLFLFAADSVAELRSQLAQLRQQLASLPGSAAADPASLAQELSQGLRGASPCRLALVAGSMRELDQQLLEITAQLDGEGPAALQRVHRPSAGRYAGTAAAQQGAGTTAFLFPGLGASYPYMLGDLCLHFPAVREVFDSIDFIARQLGEPRLPSQQVFPLPGKAAGESLGGAAVVTLLMAEWALAELLRDFGVLPDVLMGCSTGEFAALCQGGAIDAVAAVPIFYRLSLGVERGLPAEQLAALQSVLVTSGAESLAPLLQAAPGALHVSADLGSDCALLVGDRSAVAWLLTRLEALGIAAQVLASGIPYHTPFLRESAVSGAADLRALAVVPPRLPIWSCATGRTYAAAPEEILTDASALFVRPIALRQTVEAMYRAGVRTFIEVGPGDGLGRRVASILRGRPHVALASNVQTRPGLTQLLHLLAALHALGHRVDLSPLFRRHRPASPRRESSAQQPVLQAPLPTLLRTAAPRLRPLERLGTVLPALTLDLPRSDRWLCLRIDAQELRAAGADDPLTLARIYSPSERLRDRIPLEPGSLLSHLAIKRAVQELLRRRSGRSVDLPAIELAPGSAGELRARGGFTALLCGEPTIAVADCGEAAVALVAAPELAARIGVQITRAQALHLADAQTALCRALAADPGFIPDAVQVAALDPLTGWIALRAPQHPELLHARAFRVGSCFITRAVVPGRAA